jgi:RNA recognition motif-containing protein
MFGQTDGYLMTEESLKHHAQARAILGNLMGPNGEQLTSNDPYNTTVFVGGLSPLISEETLRTFFAPFGDIHYVCAFASFNCRDSYLYEGQSSRWQTLWFRPIRTESRCRTCYRKNAGFSNRWQSHPNKLGSQPM